MNQATVFITDMSIVIAHVLGPRRKSCIPPSQYRNSLRLTKFWEAWGRDPRLLQRLLTQQALAVMRSSTGCLPKPIGGGPRECLANKPHPALQRFLHIPAIKPPGLEQTAVVLTTTWLDFCLESKAGSKALQPLIWNPYKSRRRLLTARSTFDISVTASRNRDTS